MEDRSDKDTFDGGPSLPSPSSSQHGSHKRWRRRIRDVPLLGRTIRGIRWILGPSQPSSHLPPPQPSLTVSLTLGSRSWGTPLDLPLRGWTRRRRLHYGLYLFLLLWATMFVLLIRQQYYLPGPTIIQCNAGVWDNWPPDVCGVNATGCESLLDEGTYRCLGGCLDVTLGNPRWIGGEEVNQVPFVVAGDGVYR